MVSHSSAEAFAGDRCMAMHGVVHLQSEHELLWQAGRAGEQETGAETFGEARSSDLRASER